LTDKQLFFAPEVIQASAMDCGPATLKCLLDGFGLRASYGRLREACQTDVDGTSIDTMEGVAVQLGLAAEQTLVPEDHLLLPEASVLPAIVVTLNPGGLTHFVVVWRLHGPFIQVMDPSSGRRWLSRESLLSTLYQHTMPVPAGAWRDWAATDGFCAPLRQRLANLDIAQPVATRLIETALQDPGWYALAALDAATRMMTALVRAGGVQPGEEAARILERYFQRALAEGQTGGEIIPATYWRVRALPAEAVPPGGEELILLTGVVLVRVLGRAEMPAADEVPAPLPPELAAALEEEQPRPMWEVWHYLRRDGLAIYFALAVALAVVAAAGIIEVAQLRGLLDLGDRLGPDQRSGVLLILFLFAVGLLVLQLPLDATTLRAGRRLEVRMRTAFLRKIPRLNDRYFQSRLISDMTQRAHDLGSLSTLPNLGSGLTLTVFQIVLTVVAIILLDPKSLVVALLATVSAVALSLASNTYLAELDLRLRTHIGALSRFYLDALLGLIPIRTHAAERIVRREHEALLVEWARTGHQVTWAGLAVSGIQALVSTLFSIWLLLSYVSQGGTPGGVLLLFFWTLSLPGLGQNLAGLIQSYRLRHNQVLRFLEPLGAPEDTFAAADIPEATDAGEQEVTADGSAHDGEEGEGSRARGAAIELEQVTVQAAGKPILRDISLSIEPGAHVAIVGPSGAGKSSLVGLLLGWHRPASGRMGVDGRPLTATRLQNLRQETAWVDPSIQLWNRSLLDNLRYGSSQSDGLGMEEVLAQADLFDVLERMPSGLQTKLGEGGGLVSGGEGQRVRLGRAMQRPEARLVILDESFRGLDRAKRRELLGKARQMWQGATLIYITHDMSQTQDFERVIVLEDGRMIEDGSPSDLLAAEDSRYGALMRADRAVHQELWSAENWRRQVMVGGRLSEPEPVQAAEG
jgi:ATP-binding cassette subfamily B protein